MLYSAGKTPKKNTILKVLQLISRKSPKNNKKKETFYDLSDI